MDEPRPNPVPRFRFSLLTLFGFVTFAAVGCAAMASAGTIWTLVVVTSAFALLCGGNLLALLGRDPKCRAFWSGFALFGWGYLAFGWFFATYSNYEMDGCPFSFVAPNWILGKICNWISPPFYDPEGHGHPTDQDQWMRTYHVGQSLWVIVLGFIGGVAGKHLYLRREQEKASAEKSGMAPG